MRRKGYGIEVPGGVVQIDIYRGRPKAWVWLMLVGELGGAGVDEDIVIYDSSRTRELYREGPYKPRTMDRVVKRIVDEVTQVGLEEFLRVRQVQAGRLGPVQVPGDWRDWDWIVAWLQRLKRQR